MPRSKTIKLFLMDGEPSGRIKCSLANWTGIAYKIPRTALDKCKDLDILACVGKKFLPCSGIVCFWMYQPRTFL